MKGRLHTEGTVRGTRADLVIEGKSDLAQSRTTYRADLKDLHPAAAHLQIRGGSMATLLRMVGQKPYADARLDLLADLTWTDPAALSGDIDLRLDSGEIDLAVMKTAFGIHLPQARFSLETKARIDQSKIVYSSRMESNLARIFTGGSIVAEPLEADLTYDVDVKELALFRPITNAPLRGPFSTSGTVRGDRKLMTVTGRSDVAGSETSYDLDLKEMKPGRVMARIKGADLARLLYLGGQPDLAAGTLDVDLQLDSLDPDDLQGKADIRLRQGVVNTGKMKKHYGMELPKTTFTMGGDAHLAGREFRYTAGLVSNLARIESSGTVVPKTMGMDLVYDVGVKKLERLTPLTGMAMHGPLTLSGAVRGNKKRLRVEGSSDLAASRTRFEAELEDFKPRAVTAEVRHLKLKNLLSMLAQPGYADAVVDAEIAIDDARAESLQGTIVTTVSKGAVDRAVMANVFDLKMPETPFEAETKSLLNGNTIDTSASVTSPLATLVVKQARFNVKGAQMASDYRAEVPDLDKLFFATGRHLKGAVEIIGSVKMGRDFDLTAHADTLGGTVDATLHNDALHADLNAMQTQELLKMLIYPQVFRSGLTGILEYNLNAKKGGLDATLSQGQFVPTLMTSLIARLARFDLTGEVFHGNLTSDIDGEKILSNIDMRADNASVTGTNLKLITKTRQVDARLNVVANDNPIGVIVRGDVDKPKIDVDVKNLLQREAERYIEKQIGGQFKNLIKGLFK